MCCVLHAWVWAGHVCACVCVCVRAHVPGMSVTQQSKRYSNAAQANAQQHIKESSFAM